MAVGKMAVAVMVTMMDTPVESVEEEAQAGMQVVAATSDSASLQPVGANKKEWVRISN